MNAINKLSVDNELFREYFLIGIVCHLKDYRLIYYVNKALGCDLKKQNNLKVFFPKSNNESEFSFYNFTGDNFEYYVVANRNVKGVLVAEQKKTDFIFIIKGDYDKEKIKSVLDSISKIPGVMMSYIMKADSIKNFDIILSDLELHLMEISKKG
jgi:hypothetical protein